MDYVDLGKITHTLDKHSLIDRIHIRKAIPKDVGEVYRIAAAVGNKTRDSDQGFLIDDYRSDPSRYKEMFLSRIFELDYFYVAFAAHKPVAFLMAYRKDQWLKYNPDWLDRIHWSPGFKKGNTKKFILIDKTAVRSGLTGMGIGSKLYKRLIRDMASEGIENIFAETVVSPVPNFASLEFRKKQQYSLAGVRYEKHNGEILTDLIYHKRV